MFKPSGKPAAAELDQMPAAVRGNPRPEDAAVHPIAVVDDDTWVRDSLRVLLETLGFEVVAHGSGAELLADRRLHSVGCLIIDHHMPRMDGVELLSLLRGEGIDAPAILITGRLDAAITSRAASIGGTAILEKPFSTRRLIELVHLSLGDGK